MVFKLSEQQMAVVDGVRDNVYDIMVVARAGTGKTTTGLEALKAAIAGKTCMCAFNVSVKEEVAPKVPANCDALTTHGLGFKTIVEFYGENRTVKVEPDKMYNIIKPLVGRMGQLISPALKLCEHVKNHMADPTNDNLADLAAQYQVEYEARDAMALFDIVRQAIRMSIPGKYGVVEIDYNDMIWLPNVLDMPGVQYDWLLVDEAQDLCPAQHALVLRSAKNGHICFVGDPNQAIYAFRGADERSMYTLKEQLEAMGREVRELHLTKTRRCPKAVVAYANQWVPDLEALPDAPDGEVKEMNLADMNPMIGDMVICRKNAPLMPVAYSLMRAGIPVKIAGRDIGAALAKTVKGLKAISIDDLQDKLKTYQEKERMKLARLYSEKPSKLQETSQALEDKIDTITFLAAAENTIEDLLATITRLFSDVKSSKDCVLLTTIHRGKGLEAPTVYWLQTKTWGGQQENNCKYVAATRAKARLFLVNGAEN